MAITAQSVIRSPVSYISPTAPEKLFVRAPREDSDDVWTAVISRDEDDETERWVLAESVGKWDSRFK